ncbi:amidohydrolase [Sphingomonas prati]|uniref:Aminobenzoyl-glutamate utilization protein B n=1 Tax=Sphingomonas prati TaxID=1843237 RepID=A0A7W9BV80_9SPHN|nr:amidohydrolase [Sphingomonas prati]MBB5730710.1 aminobenzoyl-glutamate utilization protein B [Sphingomonas prati]GGE95788.1 aminobenzoyl-glutamate utilization protein B [Sphingomonas prati]
MRKTMMAGLLAATLPTAALQAAAPKALKAEAAAAVDAQAKQIQVMVDQVFSFAEPGFQEVRTSEYLTGILEKNGFTVTRGVAGIPTAFTATWGSGGPLIALGSDIDDLLGVSQIPGIPNQKAMIEGAPGHGEGHNAGMPLVIAAAIAAKKVMEERKIPGRLMLWPGVAEELLATKAFYVRDGLFKGVDACIFTHVGSEFGTAYGDLGQNGMVSVEYTFHGKTAHAAGSPWDGRSALDGVEVMDTAWNFRREHLPLTQRSHYVITNGGGQPNVVPDKASVWYYFRDRTFGAVRNLYEIGNQISEAAAKATGTTVTRQTLGYAAPNFANKPIAEAAQLNIEAVGMPKWSADDQAFARAVQETNQRKVEPLKSAVTPLSTPQNRPDRQGGGSDDIGDIMWAVPTITIRFPSNIPNVIGHHVTAAMAMATPIAHKGAVAGAKALAMTVLDLMTTPKLVADAKTYFTDVQLKTDSYAPVLTAADKPAIWLNARTMAEMRPAMEKHYYDPAKYDTYLEQIGVTYPTVKPQ